MPIIGEYDGTPYQLVYDKRDGHHGEAHRVPQWKPPANKPKGWWPYKKPTWGGWRARFRPYPRYHPLLGLWMAYMGFEQTDRYVFPEDKVEIFDI